LTGETGMLVLPEKLVLLALQENLVDQVNKV
jgi:hypothetical protein